MYTIEQVEAKLNERHATQQRILSNIDAMQQEAAKLIDSAIEHYRNGRSERGEALLNDIAATLRITVAS